MPWVKVTPGMIVCLGSHQAQTEIRVLFIVILFEVVNYCVVVDCCHVSGGIEGVPLVVGVVSAVHDKFLCLGNPSATDSEPFTFCD